MKKLLPILIVIISTLIVGGLIYAATYSLTVTHDIQEVELADEDKTSHKEWQVTKTEDFTYSDYVDELTELENEAQIFIDDHNLIIDKANEHKDANNLTHEVKKKLEIIEVK